jgi:hypothetical protein
METALIVLTVIGFLGGVDVVWFHEWKERLPARTASAMEQKLHAVRELLYAVFFIGLAWWHWHGFWAWLLGAVVLFELGLTAWDVMTEANSRRLSAGESALHWILTVLNGIYLALIAPVLLAWAGAPSAIGPENHGLTSLLMTALGLSVLFWGLLDSWRSWSRPAPATPVQRFI